METAAPHPVILSVSHWTPGEIQCEHSSMMPYTSTCEEDKREDYHGGRSLPWLYLALGVFLAASVGMAKGEDNQPAVTAAKEGVSMAERILRANIKRVDTPLGSETEGLCLNASCVLRAGELLSAMDREVDPCQDFYQYSCGNWMRTHSIPDGESTLNIFSELRSSVRIQLKGLLEQPYDNDTDSGTIKKAKQLYQSCLDDEIRAKVGVEPLKKLVESYGPWPLTEPNKFRQPLDLESTLAKLAEIQSSPLFSVGVATDEKNSSIFITLIRPPGFGIDRNYMVNGRNSTKVMTYTVLLRHLATRVLGLPSSQALEDAIGDIVEFEVQLAKFVTHNAYKKVTISQLHTTVPKFNWMKYLTVFFEPANIKPNNDTEVVLYAEEYLNAMLDLYDITDQRIVANYLLMRTVKDFSGFLSRDIRDLKEPLRKVLYGELETRASWKTCVDHTQNTMPDAVGQLYVKKYFSPTAKQKALELIVGVRGSMKQMISDVTWMDDATKDKALEKADVIREMVGYPDYMFDEEVLDDIYKDVDYQPDTFFENCLDYYRSSFKDSLDLLRDPRRKAWATSAPAVNAFFQYTENAITIPAGILQPPFYAEDFPMSMMYGGIGFLIGHEITHGFDNTGRTFDKDGNNVPWWSNSSVAEFQKLTQCFVDQYSQQVEVGMHVNGQLTLGENIADNGGIKAAYMAFEKWQKGNKKQPTLPGLGLSHEQIFFLNFAQIWCARTTDESAKHLVLTSSHSPRDVRVRMTVSNSPQFAEAFNCPVGSPMNPEKKCQLW